jgi:hypothetical protein
MKPNACKVPDRKHGANLVICPEPVKGKPTLAELAKLIHGCVRKHQRLCGATQGSAAYTIANAVSGGGWLRMAKRKVKYGKFGAWLKNEGHVDQRTASNWMRLHTWISVHKQQIFEAKPHSLRQLYILAGIINADDGPQVRLKTDDLARLRRLVRRTCLEAAAHRDYVRLYDVRKALEPLARLLAELEEDAQQIEQDEEQAQ